MIISIHPLLTYDTIVEVIATTTGLINVYLLARENIWNFLFGLISVSCFFLLYHDKKLYADMSRHLLYVAFQFYGYYQWRYGGKRHHGVKVYRATWPEMGGVVLAIILLASSFYYALSHYTDSTSIPLDATTTAMSLVAQWMQSRKWLQHWFLWIIMDFLALFMLLNKHLYLTTALHCLYIVLCFVGLRYWWNDWRKHHPELK